jgi:hypothetical protein
MDYSQYELLTLALAYTLGGAGVAVLGCLISDWLESRYPVTIDKRNKWR